MPVPVVVIEQPEQTQPEGVIIPPDPYVQPPRHTLPPDHTLSIPEQVKKWLMEHKYQIKKVDDVYHITNDYDRIRLSGGGSVRLKTVRFNLSGNVLYITIDGVGKAGFKVDEYGKLWAVGSLTNR